MPAATISLSTSRGVATIRGRPLTIEQIEGGVYLLYIIFTYLASSRHSVFNTGTWTLRSESGHSELELGIRSSDIGNQSSEFVNRSSDIGNRSSEFRNRSSDIGNRSSELGKQSSELSVPVGFRT